jgi:hypothetical protein
MKLIEVSIQYHKELNPKLWNGMELKPEVRAKLLEIAKAFIKYLDIPDFEPMDITMTGSSANYNWTSKSDIDLHLITRQSKHGCREVTIELFDAKKDIFASRFDIKIYGIPVELYVQDHKEPHISSGTFSVLKNEWIHEPRYHKPHYDEKEVSEKTKYIKNKIDKVLKDDAGYTAAKTLMKKIKAYRQAGLEESGEFSEENITFKSLRLCGYLGKLKKYMQQARSEELSLK